jgi:hypothetical protein
MRPASKNQAFVPPPSTNPAQTSALPLRARPLSFRFPLAARANAAIADGRDTYGKIQSDPRLLILNSFPKNSPR